VSIILQLADFIIHIDKHLAGLIAQYGLWTHLVLALIVFCETGLVVTPFLPGDSLLFAAGAFAAAGSLKLGWLLVMLPVATILGDNVNYWVGYGLGPKVFHNENSRFFNRRHLDRTHAFYQKHGGMTIIYARFIPIVRTFAPFVAGIGRMSYGWFLGYSLAGCLLWVGSFVLGGYFFGNIPIVKRNFTVVIFAIIAISVLPMAVEYLRHKLKK
jgi:membrane-associated protein